MIVTLNLVQGLYSKMLKQVQQDESKWRRHPEFTSGSNNK